MNTIDTANARPQWGAEYQSPLGAVQYYLNDLHEDTFVAERTMVVVNLVYDETDIAVNSDHLYRMSTPKDCTVVVPSGTEVQEVSKGGGEAVLFDIESQAFDRLAEEVVPNGASNLHFRKDLIDSRVGDAARAIRTAYLAGRTNDQLLMDSLLAEIQQRTFESYFGGNIASPGRLHSKLSSNAVSRVHDYMQEHLSERVGLEEMAALVNLSPYHFARSYKETTGETPYRALVERRLTRARTLLANPVHGLVDIALMTGFCSQAHMNETFRRVLSITPGEYRRAHS